ncbi:MAG: HAMP domain-containing sensor histidine kinase, partial [Alphaproteobacteria bacterium]
LNHVRSSGEHLLALVNDVLDLENVESGKILLAMEALDPRQAIGTAIGEQSAPAANKRIKVIDETSGMRLPHVYADAKRLRQILVNLLSNAIKYTDAGGVVTVAAEPRGPSLRISVADTGKGIPAEMHGRLFSPVDRLGA